MLLLNRSSVLDADWVDEKDHQTSGKKAPVGVSIGIDIGTASIISGIHNGDGGDDMIRRAPNAFYEVPGNPRTLEILSSQNMRFFQKGKGLYILGKHAERAANLFNKETRRPVRSGLLNPDEPDGIDAIMKIVTPMVSSAQRDESHVWYSIPADPIGQEGAVVYHSAMLEMHLKRMGFTPHPINEGLAVILSETDIADATALGVSIGGGMCNICFSYLSMPVISYSIQKGGDYIDHRVGYAMNKTATHIKLIKEKSLNFETGPRNRIETALKIYYEDLFKTLALSLQQVLGSSDKTCRLPGSLPLIVSGGTMLAPGSLELFKAAMTDINLPIKISDIVLAASPAEATMRGAMKMAIANG